MSRNPGYRIYHPPVYVEDWRAAYGLECIRIWQEAMDYKEATGNDLDVYFPTEEEFKEMRKVANRRRIYRGD